MNERGNQRNLNFYFFAAKNRRSGDYCDEFESARKLSYSLHQRKTFQRPPSSPSPQARRPLDQPSFGAVTRQQFGLVLGNVRELAFEGFGNPGVKRASGITQ